MEKKSNKDINITNIKGRDYVLIDEGIKTIGILRWEYTKKKWVFQDCQTKPKLIIIRNGGN